MAYVLPPSQHSPLVVSTGHATPSRSSCSQASIRSSGTVQHRRLRSISTGSFSSADSRFSRPLRRHSTADNVRTPPPISTSSLNPGFANVRNTISERRSGSGSYRTSRTSSAFSQRFRTGSLLGSEDGPLTLVNVVETKQEQRPDSIESPTNSLNTPLPETDSDRESMEDALSTQHVDALQASAAWPAESDAPSQIQTETQQAPGFRWWVSRLRKKRHPPMPSVITRTERWTLDDFDPKPLTSRSVSPQKGRRPFGHQKSLSQGSSSRFITSVRSATATVASASIATLSKRTTKWRRGQQRSSILSGSDPRPSVDSVRSVVDEAARLRSRKRREKLEELIRTEESYVADIKALSDAYFTVLGHGATTTSFARRSTQKIMADILHLHDNILGGLHSVVPFAEYDQVVALASHTAPAKTHNRWHSVDVVPSRTATMGHSALATIRQGRQSLNISRFTDDEHVILQCSPQVVAAVCGVFSKHLERFGAYEEYGLNYERVRRDIDEITRAIPTFLDYDKGYEALSAYVGPLNSRAANHKRAMTVKDLLIKPIQRLPRYELLFEDLRKLTPVYDDPSTHASISELQEQLKTICTRTNVAKEDPMRAKKLEITTLIGSRLPCSAQVPRSIFLQLLGQVVLCGCLHIAYRGRERIKGCYVICILFESTLLLCVEDEEHSMWSILAAICLGNATLQETDNYKGLQCHTAPHSWKIVFEHHAKMYELILTACSATEAEVWRGTLGTGIEATSQAVADGKANLLVLHSPLTDTMRSVGKAFGKPGSFVRRMSVHRSATVGPTADLNQVIIKNTQAVKEVQDNNSQDSLQIPRSQSLATPSHVQTLAPRRADRYRLEAVLADVWSKDLLPYPGMMRRSDPIRAGATHVIRKFSMASITSNFSSSKRTPSYTSVNSWRKEDVAPSRAAKGARRDSVTTASTRGIKPLPHPVSFHTAPDAFLPADFELQDPSRSRKRSALRTFTMTMERPFSPLLGIENKQSTLRRAQSVRDIIDDRLPPAASPIPPQPSNPTTKHEPAVYSIAPERAKTPVVQQQKESLRLTSGTHQLPAKAPRKSKSRMFRNLFH